MNAGKHNPTKKIPGKPHHFILNGMLSKIPGKMYKGKSGLFMINNESKYVYDCIRCDSQVEYNAPADVRSINVQLAKDFSCR